MFDEFVHEAAAGPPYTTCHASIDRVTAVTISGTQCRTALVRVLDEHHVDLYVTTTTTTTTTQLLLLLLLLLVQCFPKKVSLQLSAK